MANTLTGLIPTIWKNYNVVSRESIGYLTSVTIDSDAGSRAALGQTVRSPIAPVATTNTNTPSMTIPQGDDQALTYVDMTMTYSESVQIPWPGEDQLKLKEGNGFNTAFGQQLQEGFRKLSNDLEALAATSYTKASRAYGTAGTTPFASTVAEAAQIRKVLRDNGAGGDFRLVVDTTAGANVRGNVMLTNVNQAGTDDLARQGNLLPLSGITLHETAEADTHTKGTGTSYTSAATGYAVGTTDIPIITGSGTVLAGDVVTFAGDTNKYMVTTGVAAPGTISIAKPGLKVALAASAVAMTIGNSYTPNMAFSRSAIVMATRAPAIPEGGDAAVDRMTLTDPVSGLSFDIAVYVGFQKKMINIGIAAGTQVVNPAHTAILLG
ncbi:MAG: P22 coat - protein 5 family protein [Planctomycetes bacterium]|nr:P22 coat - protein 5 family protein [Planctomycetota bacterium]